MNNSSFIFPGQGSQSLGMLSDISSNFKEIQETFDLASEILGYDLWELTQKGPIEKLNQTQYTQPAILTASIGISKILENNGIIPKVVAGHSLGEFSSLVYSKTLDLTEGVDLVSYRGLIMQEAVPEGVGSMAAIIGLNSTKINDLCLSIENGTKVAIANYNSTGQTVISGYKEGILKAIELCKEAGAKKAVILPVSIPSHSFLLK
ncbi:MAG: ACP S-malonyltransferase, partial [Psittacicella sp.]